MNCDHYHYSGRRCSRKAHSVTGTEGLLWLCLVHRNGECSDCAAMQAMFPIRRDTLRSNFREEEGHAARF